MSDAIPIISIVSGAAVAILVPLITAAAQSGERQREHRRERSAALRETLVKCCFDLAEVATAAVNAARRVDIPWGVETGPSDANDPESSFRIFREQLLEAYRTSLILVIDLGPNSHVFKGFRESIELLNGLQYPLLNARSPVDKSEIEETIRQGLRSFFETEVKFHQVASEFLIGREEADESAPISIKDRLRRMR